MTVVVAVLAIVAGALIAAAVWYDILRLSGTKERRCPPLARLRGRDAALAAAERWCTGLLVHGRIDGDEYRRRMRTIALGHRVSGRLEANAISSAHTP